MRTFGLIGFPLSHSFSPGYFADKFEKENIRAASYGLFPLEKIDEVCSLLERDIQGLNVTIPYKESVIPYLDGLDEEAEAIGAVNTIASRDGKWIGFNTDIYGFNTSLIPFLGDRLIEKALVLGSGGAAKAVVYGLNKLGIKPTLVSRSDKGDLTYEDIDAAILDAHPLIINTTPLGMSPNIHTCPDIPYELLTEKHFLYDLVYNPKKTLFLNNGKQHGASIKNGYEMLCLQAEKSWSIWNQI